MYAGIIKALSPRLSGFTMEIEISPSRIPVNTCQIISQAYGMLN
jgi:hypothetical protein